MTWVKTCGLRTPDDVDVAVDAGCDAIGLVLIPESPRYVVDSEARSLAARSSVPTVILTRDVPPDEVAALMDRIGADGIQPYGLHAADSAAVVAATGRMVLRPTRVEGPVDLDGFDGSQIPLLDGFSPDALGGSGTAVREEWIPRPGSHYVLAGGLAPDTVADMVALHKPWGVDASSGLESSLGVKDPELIRAFVERAKSQ